MTTAKAFTVYSRESWRARRPRTMTHQSNPTTLFLHHSDDANGRVFDTLAKQQAKMRAIQDFHMDAPDRRYSDIGYTYVIFQPNHRHTRAHIFLARPAIYVPAATLDSNTRTIAVCIVGDGNREEMHPHTRTAVRWCAHQHPTLIGMGGHRDNPAHPGATECPGGLIYKQIDEQARILGLHRLNKK